jgi:hypothetical protein
VLRYSNSNVLLHLIACESGIDGEQVSIHTISLGSQRTCSHDRAYLPGDMQPHHEHAAQHHDECADDSVCAELGRCLPQCRNKSIAACRSALYGPYHVVPGLHRLPTQVDDHSNRNATASRRLPSAAARAVMCGVIDAHSSAAGHRMAARGHQRRATADRAKPHAFEWQQVSGARWHRVQGERWQAAVAPCSTHLHGICLTDSVLRTDVQYGRGRLQIDYREVRDDLVAVDGLAAGSARRRARCAAAKL